MRIYRGNIGVELSLEEFSEIVLEEDKIDDLLNLIYELELDEAMNYNSDEIKEFEESLFEEAAEYQKKQSTSTDVIKMKNILTHLEKYGR